MNYKILNILAIALALVMSSYYNYNKLHSRSFVICAYFIYDGTGDQCDINNYTKQTTQPSACPGNARLCWFKCCDHDNDGDVDVEDFNICFDSYDTDDDCSLDDEAEIAGILEKHI